MRRVLGWLSLIGVCFVTSAAPLHAGGGWIPGPGHGYVYLGFSRKSADSSWDPSGNYRLNANSQGVVSWHDFRYLYFGGEVGIVKNVSLVITPTWLYGLEGPKADYEKNVGLSDAWVGLKYGFNKKGEWPMALGFNHRSPYFYDLEGAYNRHLFDDEGQEKGVSPEWRGLLKRDYSVSYFVSRSIASYRGWSSAEFGYTWRDGAPADQIYFNGDVAYPLPFWSAKVKAAAHLEVSLGNDTPRQPDDRFGSSPNNNFNNASYLKIGGGAFVPFGSNKEWTFELGYNQWVWGHSARRYHEPYVSLGRAF